MGKLALSEERLKVGRGGYCSVELALPDCIYSVLADFLFIQSPSKPATEIVCKQEEQTLRPFALKLAKQSQ